MNGRGPTTRSYKGTYILTMVTDVTVLTRYDTWDNPPSPPSYFPLERHLDRLGVEHGLCRGEGLGDDHHLEVVTKSLAGGATFKAAGYSTLLTTNSKFAPEKS